MTRFIFVSVVKPLEILSGVIMICLVLEAGRRVVGLVLPLIALVFLLYGLLGHGLPGPLHHNAFTVANMVEELYMSTDGLWGDPTNAATTFVFMFVVFGSVLAATGMGQFFSDLAAGLTGRFVGGPAKAAVIGSGLMGMIQGSAISNVVTVGPFTIPAMKKYGFQSHFAGAVEAVSSCGGQIMPPVMGAAAFIMADITGIPWPMAVL